MQPGHPFFTKEFDKQRAQQRQFLRMIPDTWLQKWEQLAIAKEYRNIKPADYTGLTEQLLRNQADAQLAELEDKAKEVVLSWKRTAQHNELRDFVIGNWDQAPYEVAHFSEITDSQRSQTLPLAEQEAFPIREIVFLLIWADELADDQYRDPRLAPAEAGPD